MDLFIFFIALLTYAIRGSCVQQEASALITFKSMLFDPENVLQSWVPFSNYPCSWFHISCNELERVARIDLASASLSGSLASSLGSLPFLTHLALYSNNISGNIPEELGNLTNLKNLDLNFNILEGSIPATLGNLKNLEQLLLNNNALSGTIPVELTTIETLNIVDLSNNRLTGDVPTNGSFSRLSPISFLNNTKLNPLALSSQNFSSVSFQRALNVKGIIFAEIAGAFLLFSIPLIFFFCCKREPENNFFDLPDVREEAFHLGQLRKFSLRELQVATDQFHSRNIIGIGGFAKVYKGRLTDGSLVAVKRLKEERIRVEDHQFQMEIELISMAVHKHLIRLLGFCMTPTERLLVYPLMTNGSVLSNLKDRPPGKPPLPWETRRQIALGTARALEYLHDYCNPRILHRDVKAANILLDNNLEAVVADFGLAKVMDASKTHMVTRACGSDWHIAPEYFATGILSEKADVYGYGMTLLQLLTGHRSKTIVENSGEVGVLDWVKNALEEKRIEELVDGDLERDYCEEQVQEMAKIALLCLDESHVVRPKMAEVVTMVNGCSLGDAWQNARAGLVHRNFIHAGYSGSSFELSGPR